MELARSLLADGADLIDIGGESGVTNRPPVSAEEEIERVVPLIEAVAGELGARVSVDTYKPAVARAAIAAGASIVNDVSGLRDPELADVCAQTGAALVLMHTIAPPKTKQHDPASTGGSSPRCSASWPSASSWRRRAGWPSSSSWSTRGRTSPRPRRRPIAVLRALPALHELGRPILLAVSRKDFVGALTQRPPRDRLAGTLAAIAHGVAAGAHVLRVHDVAEAADFLAVATALGGDGEVDPGLRVSDTLRWEQSRVRPGSALDSGLRIAGRWPNATGAHRSSTPKESLCQLLDRSALEASPLADLHAIASELSIDGYRRLRRAELIDAILNKQEGGDGADAAASDEAADAEPASEAQPASGPEPQRPPRRPRPTSPPRRAGARAEPSPSPRPSPRPRPSAEAETDDDEDEDSAGRRRRRGRRGGRGRSSARDEADCRRRTADAEAEADGEDGLRFRL